MWPNQKLKDRAILPKPKLIVYIVRSQKVFVPQPNPQKGPEGPKKCKKDVLIVAELKKKKMGLYFHTINHAIQVSFLGCVDAPVMCINTYCCL